MEILVLRSLSSLAVKTLLNLRASAPNPRGNNVIERSGRIMFHSLLFVLRWKRKAVIRSTFITEKTGQPKNLRIKKTGVDIDGHSKPQLKHGLTLPSFRLKL
jgi:hypothetical protein